MEIEWKKYIVEAVGEADRVVIESPSPGLAVEYYLACHGMMTYKQSSMICQETDEEPDESREKVLEIIKEITPTMILDLDRHHTWNSIQ